MLQFLAVVGQDFTVCSSDGFMWAHAFCLLRAVGDMTINRFLAHPAIYILEEVD